MSLEDRFKKVFEQLLSIVAEKSRIVLLCFFVKKKKKPKKNLGPFIGDVKTQTNLQLI